jgi:DNA-binding winged helix-turn-helix (wHTH) protein
MNSASAITDTVAATYGLTASDLKGPRRDRLTSLARARAYHEIRRRLSWSWPRIGDFFGRDPTGVQRRARSVAAIGEHPEEMAQLLHARLNYLSGRSMVYEISRTLGLQAQESIILGVLIRSAPRPLPIDGVAELYDHAWQAINGTERYICESTVKSSIAEIRRVVTRQGLPAPVKTIRPGGYVLTSEFTAWCRENIDLSQRA